MSEPRRRVSSLPPELAAVPFGVLRPRDASDVYAYPAQEFRRLVARGALHQLAHSYYAVIPPGGRQRPWLPSLETAAFGIAAATYGLDDVALMGISAARLHGSIPRALAVAVVAVPKRRPGIRLSDRAATVVFVHRDTERIDVERVRTEMGSALVTTVEQTILDLAHRPGLGELEDEAWSAVRSLWPNADRELLAELAERQRLRAALDRAHRRLATDA
ncbi:MAG: type IV toxin-antitoxin system AbiEi family antitoxin [Actinomycetes bacterium]